MADIIQLLPDAIANQIAAGEVIQRPASVVKELLENAIDADATSIQLIVKDAGKTLIQVIDDGKGMSETDARMSLERHATSKISSSNDLFALNTMGFRGEALASIASIAHLTIQTKRKEDQLGVKLEVEGSSVNSQEPITCKDGTSMAVKNLFFNVPARRKFLKKDSIEVRHIIDEFERVAMAYPEVKFTFHHNGNEVFHLQGGNFRQRIVQIFGKRYNERLVPITELTDIVELNGFIGKPETAKKTRGEQFFFVNNRFIKNPYLNHAIQEAMEDLLPSGSHPGYFIHLKVDPSTLDVNIHPTKTEVKFENERSIYAILRSATRQALGKHHVAPTLDFEQETSFDIPLGSKPVVAPTITVDPTYNPFDTDKKSSTSSSGNSFKPQSTPQERHNLENWQKLYDQNPSLASSIHIPNGNDDDNIDLDSSNSPKQQTLTVESGQESVTSSGKAFQVHGKYIIAHIKSGVMMIHQSRAHERVLYESFIRSMASRDVASQQQLFPQTVSLPAGDAAVVQELIDDLQTAGVDIRNFGAHTFIIQGLPPYATNAEPKAFLEGILEHYKNNMQGLRLSKQEALARSLAKRSGIKSGQQLSTEEMMQLIDELFACENPYSTPSGKRIINTFTIDQLDKQFD